MELIPTSRTTQSDFYDRYSMEDADHSQRVRLAGSGARRVISARWTDAIGIKYRGACKLHRQQTERRRQRAAKPSA